MKSQRLFRSAILCVILSGLLGLAFTLVGASESSRAMRAAANAYSAHHWAEALRLAESFIDDPVHGASATLISGISLARQHRDSDAMKFLSSERDYTPRQQVVRYRELGRHYKSQGQLIVAEKYYRKVLQFEPQDFIANRELSRILSFEGRCEEAAPYLMEMIRAGRFKADELYTLGIPSRIVLSDVRLKEQGERYVPAEKIRQLGPCRVLIADHKYDLAESKLRSVVLRHPDVSLAQALLGRILVEESRWEEANRWYAELSESVLASPYIWFVRGLWARETGQPEGATRCFLETVREVPDHVEANYQLSQLFMQLGRSTLAQRFRDRSLALSKISYVVNDLRGGPDAKLFRDAVDDYHHLGRFWEAAAWCYLAMQFCEEDWPRERFKTCRQYACEYSERVPTAYHPLFEVDVNEFPVPELQAERSEPEQSEKVSVVSDRIRFENVAAVAGLDFEYFNSMDDAVGLEHIFQTTGGGIAAFDFDLDRWPDLYFSNGKLLPSTVRDIDESQAEHLDMVYRNLRGTYVSCGDEANVFSDGFGQGVTAGDFDNDGFPDIFVANVGRNRLYRNNGDGTFEEVRDSGATDTSLWSMSAMLADVDGDGLSDIYAVNYLDMQEVFDRSCKNDGQPLTCAPTLFTAEQDRLYRNLGDGRFEDVTEKYGLPHAEGKGLGIIGFRCEDKPGLQIFIANDTTQNLYYESRLGSFGFDENSVLAGVAMSEAGDMQACMGVAAGDVDSDGRLDLFVTNFYADSNTMYLQSVPGAFSDATRNCDLAEPSFGVVGFGAQFLDADLDGHLDLMVTNGHVDQAFATGEPDKMKPQFFHNQGGARFKELAAESVGSFFKEKHFGRSMARLDWNCDGKNDVVIVHLDAPAALIENQSHASQASARIYLRGTFSSRDAIGAIARVDVDGKEGVVRQLNAGDGYQASNERVLMLPVSASEDSRSTRVTIEWPNGEETQLDVTGGRDYVIIEGRTEAYLLGDN